MKFVKTFSNGQITIPKGFRDQLGIGKDFWMKITLEDGKLIAEPIADKDNKQKNEEYRKKILAIKGTWFNDKEYKEIRKGVEKRLKSHGL